MFHPKDGSHQWWLMGRSTFLLLFGILFAFMCFYMCCICGRNRTIRSPQSTTRSSQSTTRSSQSTTRSSQPKGYRQTQCLWKNPFMGWLNLKLQWCSRRLLRSRTVQSEMLTVVKKGFASFEQFSSTLRSLATRWTSMWCLHRMVNATMADRCVMA